MRMKTSQNFPQNFPQRIEDRKVLKLLERIEKRVPRESDTRETSVQAPPAKS
jgi:hypothetical protein